MVSMDGSQIESNWNKCKICLSKMDLKKSSNEKCRWDFRETSHLKFFMNEYFKNKIHLIIKKFNHNPLTKLIIIKTSPNEERWMSVWWQVNYCLYFQWNFPQHIYIYIIIKVHSSFFFVVFHSCKRIKNHKKWNDKWLPLTWLS